MKIAPVSIWFNGELQTATNFTLISIRDNFETTATLYYELQKEVVNVDTLEISYENLVTATLDISGQNYIDWSANPDANTWIYQWAATQLNLTLI
jgi:hypothetical protein